VGEIAASFERTRPLAGRPVALLQAAGLRATGPASPARTLVEAAESTAVEGWGGGPALAMAAEIGSCDGSGGRCGRLVVFGGSTVLYPPFADRGQTANLAAVLGAVDWLADRPGPPALRPVAAERIRLFLSPGMLRLYWWWLVVVMPLAAAVAGVIVVRGRRRGG
jgi:hypothetical protein